jgi:hypothetical protein
MNDIFFLYMVVNKLLMHNFVNIIVIFFVLMILFLISFSSFIIFSSEIQYLLSILSKFINGMFVMRIDIFFKNIVLK